MLKHLYFQLLWRAASAPHIWKCNFSGLALIQDQNEMFQFPVLWICIFWLSKRFLQRYLAAAVMEGKTLHQIQPKAQTQTYFKAKGKNTKDAKRSHLQQLHRGQPYIPGTHVPQISVVPRT